MKLLSLEELENFTTIMIEDLKFKPSARKEKLIRIKLAIKYIKRSADNEQLYYQANCVIDAIEEWCHGLDSEIRLQRQEHGLAVREQLPHVQDPNEYLNDEQV